jgi:hypothetical protein
MKHDNKNRQRSRKTISILFVVFLAIIVRDTTTGTLSLPLISLMGGAIALISLLVVMKD